MDKANFGSLKGHKSTGHVLNPSKTIGGSGLAGMSKAVKAAKGAGLKIGMSKAPKAIGKGC